MTRADRRGSERRRLFSVARARRDLILPWVVRALWVALPFTAGPVLADALNGASGPIRLVASVGLWAGWATGVVATFVALPLSLTALRVLSPAAVATVLAAAFSGQASALAIGWAGVTAGWLFSPAWGSLCVNGPAYPNERRFLLRAPGPLLFGPLLLAWGLTMAGLSAGPLLLASRRWLLGTLLSLVGLPVAGVLLRGLHDLSRRWAVIVPAGIVLHDPLTIVDPVLLRRQSISRLGPAPAHSGALDLTQNAPGLALKVDLTEDVQMSLLRPGRRLGEPIKTNQLLITPTRPGDLLEHAGRRRLPVG